MSDTITATVHPPTPSTIPPIPRRETTFVGLYWHWSPGCKMWLVMNTSLADTRQKADEYLQLAAARGNVAHAIIEIPGEPA